MCWSNLLLQQHRDGSILAFLFVLVLWRRVTALRRGVKPVWTPVAIFGSLGVCIYGPASRHWRISYSPIHLT